MRKPLSELQLAVMQVLWQSGGATVAGVQQALAEERPLAYSTLATVLNRLVRKGVVTHRFEGRAYRYQPAVSEEEVGTSMVRRLMENVFSGSPSDLVSHLLNARDVDTVELDLIRELVERHKAERRRKRACSEA
ncbi:MAG TPA: BlaI/MecI/CopY family transcriptional regulator [Planctomycetaceae bacterium]|nr:BlaI/MecI/CopY family transcriptional regulator [Planctomycetaceae bacterium]